MRKSILITIIFAGIFYSCDDELPSIEDKEKTPPVAAFTANKTSINKDESVNFTDQSTNSPVSWSWNFGDGSTSTSQNPSYTYNTPGTFTVSLTVNNSYGSDTETKTGYIKVNTLGSAPIAAFTANQTNIYKGETINFTDQSTNNPTSWSWNFGDGSTSTSQNPTHTYSILGKYTVSLTSTNNIGSDTVTKTDYITVSSNTPTVTDYDGNEYETVQIGDQLWMAENLKTTHYADGTEITLIESNSSWSSLIENDKAYCYYDNSETNADTYGALYTYSAAMNGANSSNNNPSGIQGVCPDDWHLPSDDEWKQLEMYLGMSQTDADGTGRRGTNEGYKMKSVNGWKEDGNGSNESGFTAIPGGDRSNTGTFGSIGSYAEFITATEYSTHSWIRYIGYDFSGIGRNSVPKGYGISIRCVKDNNSGSAPIAAFSANQTTINEGETVNFTDQSTNNPTNWSWNFGDGNTSNTQNPSHTYSIAGSYTVTLTVSNNYGADTETKTSYITVNSIGSAPVAAFIANKTSIDEGQTIDFTDQSSNDPISWSWNFGDGNTSSSQHPSHTFTTTGIYTITLTVTNNYGSDTETKSNYITVISITGTVTDYDGNSYNTIKIGNQWWMAENLKTTHYSDGTAITLVESNVNWDALSYTDEAYCYYENSSTNASIYGAMYTWAAAYNVCPVDWHLPTDNEWKELEIYLGMSESEANEIGGRGTDEGDKLKSVNGWYNNGNGTNSSGFTAIPGGYRLSNGTYTNLNISAYFWSKSESSNSSYALTRNLHYNYSKIFRYNDDKDYGFYVRCIKDD